jgi:hypothetical protein
LDLYFHRKRNLCWLSFFPPSASVFDLTEDFPKSICPLSTKTEISGLQLKLLDDLLTLLKYHLKVSNTFFWRRREEKIRNQNCPKSQLRERRFVFWGHFVRPMIYFTLFGNIKVYSTFLEAIIETKIFAETKKKTFPNWTLHVQSHISTVELKKI